MLARYYQELLNFLLRNVRDRDTAADLVQESYARIYAAQQGGQAVQDPRALLYRTARNLVVDHHRRTQVRAQVHPEPAGDAPHDPDVHIGPASTEPEALLSGRQRLAAIEDAIAALPARPREAFVLYKLDGYSRIEVAEKMGVSVKTVETHLQTAMQACLQRLQELDGTAPPQPPRT